jgi:hypothetical protein
MAACSGAPSENEKTMKDGTPFFGAVTEAATKAPPPTSKGSFHTKRGVNGQHKGIVHHFPPPPPSGAACNTACDYLTASGCGVATDCYSQICDVIVVGACDAEFQAYSACAATHPPSDCSVTGSYSGCETETQAVADCVSANPL